ncbi:MAG: hypothetical protein ABSG86_08290 [Thermoguttaceae bacterium]|jgi:hypothetical protein
MELDRLGSAADKATQEILGYLNFSSGASDPKFLRCLNHLFGLLMEEPKGAAPTWQVLYRVLRTTLEDLHGRSEAFREVDQAEAVLELVFESVLPGYRRFHADLLFHQTDEELFQPFFLGRVFEAVLAEGGPWDQAERITRNAIGRLNDFLGHRPVAVLRTQQKIQPYAHEWVRPIPLWIRSAGVAAGRYHDLVERALEILRQTDPSLLFEAMFDPDLLDELALDPRAYDFDHPVNKRPNYLFGQWDLGKLDNAGRCRRFVLQQVSLDAMLHRIEHRGNLPYAEVLFEAAAVLAGTMLMGAGVSGNRPDAHDSSVTLTTLIEQIVRYRDGFYERLLAQLEGPRAERLRAEAVALRQPLGGARQQFNQHLAWCRAAQVQHVHLAQLYARMGYAEAAARQARMVPVPSARMKCDIRCRLTAAQRLIEAARAAEGAEAGGAAAGPPRPALDPTPLLEQAAVLLAEVEDLVHRAIECGALVDPWNVLGFGGQYSLFPSPENSVYDHRIDELIALVAEIFDVYVQIQKEAAAAGRAATQAMAASRLEALAAWWDQFATTEVGSIESISGRETCESANHVAAALRTWHEAGTAAGDLAFWRGRSEHFRSPKAYALVVDALLEHRDPVASMALVVQWLSQAEEIPLVEENYSFHVLAIDWMEELWAEPEDEAQGAGIDRWALACKFLDYLEANAEQYWEVPRCELAVPGLPGDAADQPADEPGDLFSAAYEGMTYRDSTDDGFEGEMLEGGQTGQDATDFELVLEAERIVGRLSFLVTLARLWKLAAVATFGRDSAGVGSPAPNRGRPARNAGARPQGPPRDQVLRAWLQRAVQNLQALADLMAVIHRYRVPPPGGTQESLMEYDRRRGVKETLLEQIIAACVEMGDAARLLRVVMDEYPSPAGLQPWEGPAESVLRAVLRGEPAEVRKTWRKLLAVLADQTILYVALARGGHPQRLVASRGLQSVLRRLLAYLPQLGLLRETAQLIAAIQEMEVHHPVGPGAVTEFDQMFAIGCKALIRSLVAAAESWSPPGEGPAAGDGELIAFLEQAVEALLRSWLIHSRGVRLSVLESVGSKTRWQELRDFIERYGQGLFTQRFMNLGNLRAILHQGVEAWLDALADEPGAADLRLLAELGGPLPREQAVHCLSLALESVVENYAEYIDYNSTTTQSDRGEMLYTLLDYLRLRTNYDRVAWNLQPVVLAHQVLVRLGHDEAAEVWRTAVAERTATIAEDHLKRFARLNRKYAMRLPSIADRLAERFVRPLEVDRLSALVRPAIEESRSGAGAAACVRRGAADPAETQGGPPGPEPSAAFARLEAGVEQFTREVTGAGFDVPVWLEALELEVDRVLSAGPEDEELPGPDLPVPEVRLPREEVRRQMRAMNPEA